MAGVDRGGNLPRLVARGKRVLAAENPNPGAQPRLDIVLNWFAEVRRKVQEAKGQ